MGPIQWIAEVIPNEKEKSMNQAPEMNVLNLELEIEDLEAKGRPCCGSSTTSPLCTCPIFLTKCCSMMESTDQ